MIFCRSIVCRNKKVNLRELLNLLHILFDKMCNLKGVDRHIDTFNVGNLLIRMRQITYKKCIPYLRYLSLIFRSLPLFDRLRQLVYHAYGISLPVIRKLLLQSDKMLILCVLCTINFHFY